MTAIYKLLRVVIALLATAGAPVLGADAVNQVKLTSTSDLSLNTNYSLATLPTTVQDMTFIAGTYTVTSSGTIATFNVNNGALTPGTLDDANITESIVISNATGKAGTITLSTLANGQSGTAADLLWVKTGGRLTIQDGSGTVGLNLTQSGNIDVAGTGTLNVTGSTTITAGKTITFIGTGATTIGGTITATTGAIVINDAGGSVTLSGTGAYSGTTTVTAGTLNLSGSLTASNVTVNGGTFSETSTGAINGSGKTFTLSGGTATLAGVNSYTGATTINSGSTLTLAGSIASGSALIVGNATSGAGTLSYGKTGLQTFNGTTILAGASSLAATSSTGTLALGSVTRNVAGGTVDFASTGKITTTTANASVTGGQQTILGGYATWNGESTWAVSGSGATAGTISGLSSFSSSFTAGKDVDAVIGTTGSVSGTINSLRFNNTGAYTVNTSGGLTVATGGILETSSVGNNAVTINNNTLTSGNGLDLVVIQNNTSNTMDISSQITGSIGLTKSGSGTLILSNAESYTGLTTVTAGTLQLGTGGSLNSGNNLTTMAGTTFDLNGNSETFGALINSGTITNSSTTSATLTSSGASSGTGAITGTIDTIISNASSTNNTISNSFNTVGTITNSGGGTNTDIISGTIGTNVTGLIENSTTSNLTLTGSSSFNGPITISAGTLTLGTGGGNASIGGLNYSNNMLDNGTFSLSSSAFQVISGVISGSGNVMITQGALDLTGQNTYTGTTYINGGTQIIADSAENPGVSGAVGNGGTITFGLGSSTFLSFTAVNTFDYSSRFSTAAQAMKINPNGQTVTFSTPLMAGQAGTLILQDFLSSTGKLILNAPETYTGLTTIAKGILQLGVGASLNSGNNLSITSSQGSFDLNGNNQTLGVLTNASSGTVTNSNATSSTLTVGDGSTHTGTSLITGNLNVIWNAVGTSASLTGSFTNNGNLAFNTNGAGNISVTGTVSNVGTITNSGSGAGTTTIGSKIGTSTTGVIQNSSASMLVLSGANTYTGPTTINAGTLQINGSNTSSATTINSGGTLAGTGIAGALTLNAGGSMAPGVGGSDTTGNLKATGLTWNSGSSLTFNLDGSSLNSTSLTLSGVLAAGTAGSPFTITLTDNGTMNTTGIYALVNFSSSTGFANASAFTYSEGSKYDPWRAFQDLQFPWAYRRSLEEIC